MSASCASLSATGGVLGTSGGVPDGPGGSDCLVGGARDVSGSAFEIVTGGVPTTGDCFMFPPLCMIGRAGSAAGRVFTLAGWEGAAGDVCSGGESGFEAHQRRRSVFVMTLHASMS